jgi:hypothetical protein
VGFAPLRYFMPNATMHEVWKCPTARRMRDQNPYRAVFAARSLRALGFNENETGEKFSNGKEFGSDRTKA